MKLTHQQRVRIEDCNYGMFDTLGNYMVGRFLVNLLERKNLSMKTDMEDLIAIAHEVSGAFPESEAGDTAVREAIVSVVLQLVKESV